MVLEQKNINRSIRNSISQSLPMFVCSLISRKDNSELALKRSRVIPWYMLTETSFIPQRNFALKIIVPSE